MKNTKKEFEEFFKPYSKTVDRANNHGFWKLSDDLVIQILKNKALEKIGNQEIFQNLVEAKGEYLQAFLLHLFSERIKGLEVKDILHQSEQNRFLQHSEIPLRDFVFFDNLALEKLDDEFRTLELPPLAPIGLNSVITSIDQKNVISTSRNVEVVSDALPILAIEYDRLRRKEVGDKKDSYPIHLYTSQRMTRAQNFERIEGFKSHFKAAFLFSADKFLRRWELIEEYIEKHKQIKMAKDILLWTGDLLIGLIKFPIVKGT